MKHRVSNGAGMRAERLIGGFMSPLLWKIAIKSTSEPHKPSKKAKSRPSCIYTEEQIAHMRWMLEVGRGTYKDVCALAKCDQSYAYRVGEGVIRGCIQPKRHPDPAALFANVKPQNKELQ